MGRRPAALRLRPAGHRGVLAADARRPGGRSASRPSTDDQASTLELYRDGAAAQAARGTAFGDDPLAWLDSPEGTLAFSRGDDFVCTVNLTDEPVELPAPGRILLASAEPVARGDASGAGPIAGGDLYARTRLRRLVGTR